MLTVYFIMWYCIDLKVCKLKSVYTMEEGWYQLKHIPHLQKLQGIFFVVLFGINGECKSVFVGHSGVILADFECCSTIPV